MGAIDAPPLTVADLAYLAGVLDTRGLITTRRAGETLLPLVALSTGDTRLLGWLAEITGMRAIETRRDYTRVGCSQHCAQKHQHIVSVSGRWSVSGAKATVVLAAVRPYLRLRTDDADAALLVGLRAPHKPATPRKMAALGWPLPEWIGGTVGAES